MTLHQKVLNIVKDRDEPKELPGGIVFNYKRTIDRIKAYRNRQYLDRSDDAIFWDLGTHRSQHFAKNIDLDSRDLQPYSEGEASYLQVLILRQKFYRWLETTRYALKLNEMSEDLSDFGSAVQKVYKKDGKQIVEMCDLSLLYFDVLTKDLRNTPVVEEHRMDSAELMEKSDVWDLTTIGLANDEDKDWTIYEYTGWDGEEYVKAFFEEGTPDPLYRSVTKESDNPYFDYHIGSYKGRWLRNGVYERLFTVQERANRLVNENAKTQEIASLLLLRTSNPAMDANVLTQAESGMIIPSDDLQQIAIDNRSLNAFVQEMQMIENQADRLAFTPEVITGDDLPSGTPFRSVATISSAAKSTFKMVREYYGEQLGYFLKEYVFPSVVKEWNQKESIVILRDESDVRYYDKQMKKLVRWRNFVEKMLNGNIPTQTDLQLVEQDYEENIDTVQRKLKLPKDFFNFDYNIRTNITNEQENKQAMNDAYFNAIQMVAANPALNNIPLFRQYLENNNINYWRLTPQQQQSLEQSTGSGTGGAEAIGASQDKLLAAANVQ